jgi:A/G-specific adenine glycosylase
MNRKDADQLLKWYRKEKRMLPWRGTGNPEDVWISEIMLQQTRVEAVKDYFTRFRTALPGMEAIASCPEDRLMKLWEGLGYYSRVRNIKKCAEICIRDYGGKLPADYGTLLSLPGIGAYTAGAIASIAFGIPVPAVDGNVLRVYARLTGSRDDIAGPETKKRFTAELQSFLKQEAEKPSFSISDFNQSLMELGALLCVPNGAPLCGKCPLQKSCAAFLTGETGSIPFHSPKKARRIEERTLFIIRDGEKFLFRKRPPKGLLAGLYEFPGEPGFLSETEALDAAKRLGTEPLFIEPLPDAKHIFTHIEWHMKAYGIRVSSFADAARHLPDNVKFVTKKELKSFAVPSAFRTYIDYYALEDAR